MITNNFRQVLKMILVNYNGKSKGGIPVKDVNGATKYLCEMNGWPSASSVQTQIQINSYARAGIWLGSGTTQESVTDYGLETRITSGLSGTCQIDGNNTLDLNGNPQIKMILTLTNTGNTDVTVSEISYMQNVYMANDQNGTGKTNAPILIDRTLLNTPVTIPAGESAAITYTLKTVIS